MAAGPGLDPELDEPVELGGVVDEVGAACDEHTPAFAHRFVDLVDLKADGAAGCCGEDTFGAGAEDDVAVEEAEVDRQRDRSLRGEEDETADAPAGEMRFALFAAEHVEVRMRAGASRPGRPIDIAAAQMHDGRLERGRESKQLTGAECGRIVLEVFEVAGVHAGTACDLLPRQIQLLPAMSDAARTKVFMVGFGLRCF